MLRMITQMDIEKYFRPARLVAGTIGGTVVSLLGGWDLLLKTILLLIVIDYTSGILKGIYQKKLSSAMGYKGIVKKVMILLVIALAYAIQQMFATGLPIREVTISLFIGNESLSILENAAACDLPVPKVLKDLLIQIRDSYQKHEKQ